MVAQSYNPNTQKDEAEDSHLRGCLIKQSVCEASLG